MKPMLLTFNMAPEHVARLRFMCMKMGAVVQPVAPQDFTQTLGTLCGMAPRQDVPAPETPFTDDMLVMANFSTPMAKQFLAAFRQSRIPNVKAKAVVTPTNVQWDCMHLHDELMKEREAIAAHGRADHHEE